MQISPFHAQLQTFQSQKPISPRFGATEKSILREVGEAGVDFVKGFTQEYKAAPLKEKLVILPIILGCVIATPLALLVKFPIFVKDMAQLVANRRHPQTPPTL